MSTFLRRGLFTALLFSGASLPADSPRAARQDRKRFSADHRFFLLSRVKEGRTQVFHTMKPTVILWEVPVYIANPDLSSDGQHIAALYEGGNILGVDAHPEDALVTFYNANGTSHRVKIGEIVPDLNALRKTSSGHSWGYSVGFGTSDRYTIVLADGRSLHLSPESDKP